MKGSEIRALILQNGIKIWQVADAFGVTDTTFSKKLRYDFSDADTKRILAIIEQLKAEKGA